VALYEHLNWLALWDKSLFIVWLVVEGGHSGLREGGLYRCSGRCVGHPLRELLDPVTGAGQVLVRVEAVAVNNVDIYLRSGRWRGEVSFPLVLGRDLAGTVAAVGVGVTGTARVAFVRGVVHPSG
jgi:hypothetical protein